MSPSNSTNSFLSSLSKEDAALLEPHLRRMELPLGAVLYRAEEPIKRIYFPENGVVSLVVVLSAGQFIEASMFGRNGVIGGGALLGGPIALNQAIGQAASSGLVGDVAALKQIVDHSGTLRRALASHEQMFIAQVQQVAACNAIHELEERLCRWLLQVRDLLQSDVLPVTQEFLAQMIGVQRSSVTLVARRLQDAGLIAYRRGRIQLLDDEGLRDCACECYDAINSHFRRLTGWTP